MEIYASERESQALEIIKHRGHIDPLKFARAFWPDSKMHEQSVFKVRRYGMAYLHKLIRKGWVEAKDPMTYVLKKQIK